VKSQVSTTGKPSTSRSDVPQGQEEKDGQKDNWEKKGRNGTPSGGPGGKNSHNCDLLTGAALNRRKKVLKGVEEIEE